MTRTMFDSVTAAHLPAGADLYAAYVNGLYANVAAVQQRFPGKKIVTIAVTTSADADVLDVERGDATPVEAPAWVQRQRKRGADPTVYCEASAWSTVRSAFAQAAVPEPHYWIAKYDNDPTLMPGAVAKQYGGNIAGNYDASVVADHWPGVDPPEDDLLPEQAQQLAEVHEWIAKLVNGVPLYGIEPEVPNATFEHRTIDNIARKVGAVVAGPDNPLGS